VDGGHLPSLVVEDGEVVAEEGSDLLQNEDVLVDESHGSMVSHASELLESGPSTGRSARERGL
jgi:hypothetical protein